MRGTKIVDYLNHIERTQFLYNSHYTTGVVEQLRKDFTNVEIYDLHEIMGSSSRKEKDLKEMKNVIEIFFCKAIHNAPNTCNKVKESVAKQRAEAQQAVVNSEQVLIYMELA